jgi:ABC-type branched-subunit amino acid transport system substrate-binding protein
MFVRCPSRPPAALLAVALAWSAACATPAKQRRVDEGPRVAEPKPEADQDPFDAPSRAFTDALARAATPSARAALVDEAVQEALDEGRGARAVRVLLAGRELARAPGRRAELEARVLELLDEAVRPIGLRTLLEEAKPRRFPHEHLLFKVALVQLHAGERVAGADTLARYRQRYPSGVYAERAAAREAELGRLAAVRTQTLGVLLPLSGSKGAYGRLARQALELAFEGSRVELVVADTKGHEAGAQAAVEELVLEHGAIGLLGPVFRSESRAAAVMAQRLGVPLLTISAAEDVAGYGPWIFRNGVTNQAQAEALVQYAMEVLGLRTFAILHPRHPYGVELRDLFWDEVLERGGEIRGVESYAVDATTFSGPVKRLVGRAEPERRPDYREALEACDDQPDSYRRRRCREDVRKNLKPLVDFEGLFIPDYVRSVRMIAPALAAEDIIVEKDPRRLKRIERTLGRTPEVVTLLGASGWNSPKITDSTGRTVENAVFTDGFFAQAEDERTARFVGTYEERHGRTPRLYPEALMYDSARILRSVLEAEQPPDRMALREALRAVTRFPGVTGATTFGGETDAEKDLKILTITDGRIVEVPPVAPAAAVPGATP